MSNTEPLLRLNVEGRTTDDVHRVVDRVEAQIAAIGEQPQAVP